MFSLPPLSSIPSISSTTSMQSTSITSSSNTATSSSSSSGTSYPRTLSPLPLKNLTTSSQDKSPSSSDSDSPPLTSALSNHSISILRPDSSNGISPPLTHRVSSGTGCGKSSESSSTIPHLALPTSVQVLSPPTAPCKKRLAKGKTIQSPGNYSPGLESDPNLRHLTPILQRQQEILDELNALKIRIASMENARTQEVSAPKKEEQKGPKTEDVRSRGVQALHIRTAELRNRENFKSTRKLSQYEDMAQAVGSDLTTVTRPEFLMFQDNCVSKAEFISLQNKMSQMIAALKSFNKKFNDL